MSSSTATKEAVMFILDTNATMNKPYNSSSFTTTTTTTRLECCKKVIIQMTSNLILQSKSNEVGVVLLKTAETSHHLCNDNNDEMEEEQEQEMPFPNITEISPVTKPTVSLLHQIQSIQATSSSSSQTLQGDFCDGLIVASNALYQRTNKKRYNRKMILFTDASHKVQMDVEQLGIVVDSLRNTLDCKLEVIGLDFSYEGDFLGAVKKEEEIKDEEEDGEMEQAIAGDENNGENEENYEKYRILKNKTNQNNDPLGVDDDDDETDDEVDTHNNNSTTQQQQLIKNENEKLLLSLARLTNGSVIAASTLSQILNATLGKKRTPKSMRRKVQFTIAPNLVINARFSLLISKATLPSLKKECTMVNTDNSKKLDGLGQVMTSAISTSTTHWNAQDENVEVPLAEQTKAFKYGSDLVPIGGFDLEGLKIRCGKPSIFILGYVDVKVIPRSVLIGPTYAVYGDDENKRAKVAISALAQGLWKLKKVAMCRFVKSKDADPLIGALFPLVNTTTAAGEIRKKKEETSEAKKNSLPNKLFFVQLPFAEDVQKRTIPPPFTSDTTNDEDETARREKEASVCDDLIDSLMIQPNNNNNGLCNGKVPNPTKRSFHKTVIHRAVNPKSSRIISARSFCNRTSPSTSAVASDNDDASLEYAEEDENDLMATPEYLLSRAADKIQAFRETFPLEKMVDDNGKGKGGARSKKRQFWAD